jgi:hypothetical protein
LPLHQLKEQLRVLKNKENYKNLINQQNNRQNYNPNIRTFQTPNINNKFNNHSSVKFDYSLPENNSMRNNRNGWYTSRNIPINFFNNRFNINGNRRNSFEFNKQQTYNKARDLNDFINDKELINNRVSESYASAKIISKEQLFA